jgi:hypothetical protein
MLQARQRCADFIRAYQAALIANVGLRGSHIVGEALRADGMSCARMSKVTGRKRLEE